MCPAARVHADVAPQPVLRSCPGILRDAPQPHTMQGPGIAANCGLLSAGGACAGRGWKARGEEGGREGGNGGEDGEGGKWEEGSWEGDPEEGRKK